MKHFYKLIVCYLVITNFNDLFASNLPTIIHNNHNINANTNINPHITITIDFSKMFESMGHAINNTRKLASQKYTDTKKLAKQKCQEIKIWLKGHKYVLVGAGVGALYTGIIYQLNLGKKILQDQSNWANWCNHISLAELINKPTKIICHELHQAILDKYSNSKQQDALAPIILFSYDLNKELKKLKMFCALGDRLSQARIEKLFLFSDLELEQAKDKVNRLIYLKKVIVESIQISLAK